MIRLIIYLLVAQTIAAMDSKTHTKQIVKEKKDEGQHCRIMTFSRLYQSLRIKRGEERPCHRDQQDVSFTAIQEILRRMEKMYYYAEEKKTGIGAHALFVLNELCEVWGGPLFSTYPEYKFFKMYHEKEDRAGSSIITQEYNPKQLLISAHLVKKKHIVDIQEENKSRYQPEKYVALIIPLVYQDKSHSFVIDFNNKWVKRIKNNE